MDVQRPVAAGVERTACSPTSRSGCSGSAGRWRRPCDWRTNPPRIDTGTSVADRGGLDWPATGGPFTFDRNKPQINWTSTYYLPGEGRQPRLQVRLRVARTTSRGSPATAIPGRCLYRELNGAIDEVRVTDLGTFGDFGTSWTGADDRNKRHSLFFQDRWSPSARLTLTLGVRWDRQQPHYEAAIRTPVLTAIFPAQTVPATTLLTSDQVVPRSRVQLRPDRRPAASGVKAFYGRYYFNFADRLAGVNPGGTNSSRLPVQRSERQPDLRRRAGARRVGRLGGRQQHHAGSRT